MPRSIILEIKNGLTECSLRGFYVYSKGATLLSSHLCVRCHTSSTVLISHDKSLPDYPREKGSMLSCIS